MPTTPIPDADAVDVTADEAEQTSARRRATRRGHKRDLIMRAAADVFAEVGFERATLESVGERVGLTKASIYHYFRSKEELLSYVVARSVRVQEQAVAARTGPDRDPVESLRVFVEVHLAEIFSDPAARIAAQFAFMHHTDPAVRAAFHSYGQRLDAIIAAGVQAGVFRDVAPGLVRNVLAAAVNSVPLWYSADGPLSVTQVGDAICDLLINGMLQPSTT